mmetsp:Transcript_10622/g.14620  ORF Transcript_10622/g.14620 Transcript_10622/m.14620 type:complete len:85 (+) Transcript_10622:632-886(+)
MLGHRRRREGWWDSPKLVRHRVRSSSGCPVSQSPSFPYLDQEGPTASQPASHGMPYWTSSDGSAEIRKIPYLGLSGPFWKTMGS